MIMKYFHESIWFWTLSHTLIRNIPLIFLGLIWGPEPRPLPLWCYCVSRMCVDQGDKIFPSLSRLNFEFTILRTRSPGPGYQ